MEVAIVFLGMSSLVAVPLAVLLGIPMLAWLGRETLRLRERELDLKRLELVAKIRESQALPAWVDRNDARALLAWVEADRELARLTDRAPMAD